MKRLKDEYLQAIEKIVPLRGKDVLEIGCGNGSRSVEMAKSCAHLTAMEPDIAALAFAKANNASDNIIYVQGSAEALGFYDKSFDVALFTISFHHVPIEQMKTAIDEAVRVTKKGGAIVFLEPTGEGSFFEAEIAFDACDGDEREEKSAAFNALTAYPGYEKIAEVSDETVFQFDSTNDFTDTMSPKRNIQELDAFLDKNDFILKAIRRISIFRV